jgi:DNA repair protein RadA/Sms
MNESKAEVLILDSIQTITSENSSGIPGGLAQVKYCATQLTSAAKQLDKTLIIVGHINKQGNIAGPKILEHLVDTVLLFEGEDRTGLRLLRPKKNRFGSTEEVGIFVMTEGGLEPIDNPGEYFVKSGSDSQKKDRTIGSVKTVVMEGVRPIILEVQALVVPTSFAYPKRVAEGIQVSRLQLLVAVMEKFLRLNLNNYDIYINVSQGFKVEDRSLDLAVIKAIHSSLEDIPVASNSVYFGEASLSGGIIQVRSAKRREKEAKRLGYEQIFSPGNLSSITDIS